MRRPCIICGGSLEGRRADCVTCSPACRRTAGRVRAILSGKGDGPYVTVAQLLYAARRRAKHGQETRP